tara:strand:+ start:681 stop:962 length:282 start_codon:yes stop_codon:yes gene_type:complete
MERCSVTPELGEGATERHSLWDYKMDSEKINTTFGTLVDSFTTWSDAANFAKGWNRAVADAGQPRERQVRIHPTVNGWEVRKALLLFGMHSKA